MEAQKMKKKNKNKKKRRRSEVKRADLLWQVAQGRRCPNRPPDSLLLPSPQTFSPSGTTRSIQVSLFFETLLDNSVPSSLLLSLVFFTLPRDI